MIIYIISCSPRIVFILCKQSIISLLNIQPKCLKQLVKNFESSDSNVLCSLAWVCFSSVLLWHLWWLTGTFAAIGLCEIFFLNGAWSCWDGKAPPSSLKAFWSLGGVNFKACLRWSDVKVSNSEQINEL